LPKRIRLLFSVCLLSFTHGLAEDAPPDGTLISSQLYAFPFSSYSEWTRTMAGKGLADWSTVLEKERFDRFMANETIVGERITYCSDGLKINGFLIQPRKPEGPLPVVIYNRGGTLKWARITFFEILELYNLASQGFVVLASHLRGVGGSEGQCEFAAGDIRDTLNLIKFAKSLPNADTNRIGMWGFSRGALTTYLCLTRDSRIKAAVIHGGEDDAVNAHRRAEFDEFVYPHVLEDYAKDKEKALQKISPHLWAGSIPDDTALLLLHGGSDWRVLPDSALTMAQRLQQLGRSYRLVIYEGGSHSLVEHWQEVRGQIHQWFDRYLKNDNPAPKNQPVPPSEQ